MKALKLRIPGGYLVIALMPKLSRQTSEGEVPPHGQVMQRFQHLTSMIKLSLLIQIGFCPLHGADRIYSGRVSLQLGTITLTQPTTLSLLHPAEEQKQEERRRESIWKQYT